MGGLVLKDPFSVRKTLSALAAVISLSGCEGAEYAPFVALAPVLVPVGVAVEVALAATTTTQPVQVITSNGTNLAGPADSAQRAKQIVRMPKTGVTCEGVARASGRRLTSAQVPLLCSDGQTGEANISRSLSIGNEMALYTQRGDKVITACRGGFISTADKSGPFLVKCNDFQEEWADFTKTKIQKNIVNVREGAVSVLFNTSGAYQVKVWLP